MSSSECGSSEPERRHTRNAERGTRNEFGVPNSECGSNSEPECRVRLKPGRSRVSFAVRCVRSALSTPAPTARPATGSSRSRSELRPSRGSSVQDHEEIDGGEPDRPIDGEIDPPREDGLAEQHRASRRDTSGCGRSGTGRARPAFAAGRPARASRALRGRTARSSRRAPTIPLRPGRARAAPRVRPHRVGRPARRRTARGCTRRSSPGRAPPRTRCVRPATARPLQTSHPRGR